MTDISGWRRAYNAVEGNLTPRVEALVHSDEFAQMTAAIARTRRLAGNRVNAIAARFWHLMNLPASTDLKRLRMQVGALDREVRRLSLQLDRDAPKPDWKSFDRAAPFEPDERHRAGASRGRTQRTAGA